MKVVLDRVLCVGHGRCYMVSPEVFDEDERGHCVLKMEEVPKSLHGAARDGVEACPEEAITLVEHGPS